MWHHLLFGSLFALAVSGASEAIFSVAGLPSAEVPGTSIEMAKNSRQPLHRGSGRRTLLPYVYSVSV